jgi:hypothetical protein
MKEIRKILIKARLDRRGKDKVYTAKDSELSLKNSAVSFNEETTETKLDYESLLLQ